LLTNERATSQAVRGALEAAASAVKAGEADILIVHFSCHGSQSGQLVLYDTDLDRLSETTISLSEVAETLADIPVDQVVITQDCCFSGAVLGQAGSLNREAFDRFMQPLRGEGRFVVWAAGPAEQAYENRRLAHGFLSYALAASIDTFRATGHTTVGIPEWLTTSIAH